MKISEIIIDRYKLRIPPTVYYDLLADVQEAEEEQEPQSFKWCTDCKEYDQEKHCCHRWSKVIRDTVEEMKQEPRWIPVSERLPNKDQWVLVTTEDHQKIADVMCYQGIRIGQHDVGNGWEEYEYPSWTSGHGDIQGNHPKAWMPLPQPYKTESEET